VWNDNHSHRNSDQRETHRRFAGQQLGDPKVSNRNRKNQRPKQAEKLYDPESHWSL